MCLAGFEFFELRRDTAMNRLRVIHCPECVEQRFDIVIRVANPGYLEAISIDVKYA